MKHLLKTTAVVAIVALSGCNAHGGGLSNKKKVPSLVVSLVVLLVINLVVVLVMLPPLHWVLCWVLLLVNL